jgi:hypothetical protein
VASVEMTVWDWIKKEGLPMIRQPYLIWGGSRV